VATLQNEHIQELTDICARLEAMASASHGSDPAAAIADATARFAELGGDGDTALAERFAKAVEAVRAAAAAPPAGDSGPVDLDAPTVVNLRVPEPEPTAEPAPDPAPDPAAAEPAPADTAPVEAVSAAAEPEPEPEAPAAPPVLTEEEQAQRIAQLAQMLDGADQLLNATDLPDARARWMALRREWTTLLHGVTLDEGTSARVKDIEARIDAREAELREARTRQQHENLNRLQQSCDQLEKLTQERLDAQLRR
jgi:hypothetical protein